jgi:hypothetical protein
VQAEPAVQAAVLAVHQWVVRAVSPAVRVVSLVVRAVRVGQQAVGADPAAVLAIQGPRA